MRVRRHTLSQARTAVATRAPRGVIVGSDDPEGSVAADREVAFRLLADRQLTDAYGLAFAILRDRSRAHDAVHDAFVTAWQKYRGLRDRAKFEPWFRRILVNTCRDRLSEAARQRTADIDAHADLASADRTDAIVERETLAAAISGLKPDDRVVLALRYYRDLRIDDIAAALDVPPNTVASRLHRAHKRLRTALEQAETKDSRHG